MAVVEIERGRIGTTIVWHGALDAPSAWRHAHRIMLEALGPADVTIDLRGVLEVTTDGFRTLIRACGIAVERRTRVQILLSASLLAEFQLFVRDDVRSRQSAGTCPNGSSGSIGIPSLN